MRQVIFVSLFTLFALLSGGVFLVTDQAYAGAGCCMCKFGGGYWLIKGCTPPGQRYNGYICPWCLPKSKSAETILSDATIYNDPPGMRAVGELLPAAITQQDPPDTVLTLMIGGQCARRSSELRLLSKADEGLSNKSLSLYEQRGTESPLPYQIAAHAD